MGAVPLPPLVLGSQWTCTTTARSRAQALLTVRRNDSAEVAVEVQRCSAGRLRHAYPAGAHDVEVRIAEASTPELCTDVLRVLADAIQAADPRCRRVVFAAPVDDLEAVTAAQAAGYRYVVEVEVPGKALSLLVAEPEWVTRVDTDLDRVPGT